MVDATGLSPMADPMDDPKDDPKDDPARDDAREGDSDGGGSFDLADCTRSSSFCILPIRPRI